MSPNRRQRAYAQRRYQKWQVKQVTRQARQKRIRRNSAVAAAAVGVVAVILATLYLVTGKGSGSSSAAASAPTASSSATAAPANNPCPVPTVKPPAKPKTFKAPAPDAAGNRTWDLTLKTSCGPIVVQMDGAKAPHATSAMLLLARSGFFDGSPCHRLVTEGIYVLQCGDPTGTGRGGPGFSYGPVENAPKNNLYPAGTVAMARRKDDGNSNGSQFFLVYRDSTIPSDAAGGYTVIGKVVGGEAVVEKIAAGGVAVDGGDGKPVRALSIESTGVAPG